MRERYDPIQLGFLMLTDKSLIEKVAKEEKVAFVDHTKYSVWRLQKLGYTAANALYPLDNTHTDATGAKRKVPPIFVSNDTANEIPF